MKEIARLVANMRGRNCEMHFEGEYIDDPGSARTGWKINSLKPVTDGIELSGFSSGMCGINLLIQKANKAGESKVSVDITCGKCSLRKHVELQKYEIIVV